MSREARSIRLDFAWDDSEWLADLPWSARAVWILILCHAGRGVNGTAAWRAEGFARLHDVPLEDVQAAVYAAVKAGVVVVTDDAIAVRHWRIYSRDAKHAISDIVFERDHFKCKACGTGRSLTVDHVVPRARGGKDELSNYQTLCATCNGRKNAREDQ